MNIAYWIVAGLLALFYGYAGTLKMIHSPDQLRPMMAWVDRLPLPPSGHWGRSKSSARPA